MFFKLTADQVLVFNWIAGSNQVNTPRQKERLHVKAKVGHKLNPWCVFYFSSDIPCTIVPTTLEKLVTGNMLIGKKLIVEPQAEQYYMLTIDHLFLFSDPRKTNLFFPLWITYCNQEL